MKIQKKKWLTFAAAAIIATGVLGMTSLAAGRADLNAKTGGPGEASVSDSSVSTGEKPGDIQQNQQMVPVSQILTVAGTGDCNADISYYKKENGKYQLNLWMANKIIFLEAGIPEENISMPNLCTCCNPDFLFSHRASHGKRGNLGAFLGIRS